MSQKSFFQTKGGESVSVVGAEALSKNELHEIEKMITLLIDPGGGHILEIVTKDVYFSGMIVRGQDGTLHLKWECVDGGDLVRTGVVGANKEIFGSLEVETLFRVVTIHPEVCLKCFIRGDFPSFITRKGTGEKYVVPSKYAVGEKFRLYCVDWEVIKNSQEAGRYVFEVKKIA